MYAMCAQRKICARKEHAQGVMMDLCRFQVITMMLLVLCGIFGVAHSVAAVVTDEKEGI